MPAAVRCFLALTVLLTGGASALVVDDGPGPAAGQRQVAAELTDTSWGDEYVKPQL